LHAGELVDVAAGEPDFSGDAVGDHAHGVENLMRAVVDWGC
jgi:hypothetical protein